MIARRLARFAPLALAVSIASVAATGCATFTDNDVIAKVGDQELTSDELLDRLNGVDPSATTPGGTTPPTVPLVDGRVDGDQARSAVSGWIAEQLGGETDLAARYDADPSSLGITCLDIAIAADEADAQSILATLQGGTAWDDVVAPIEQTYGYESAQPCLALDTYLQQLDQSVIDQFAALSPGDDPVVLDGGGAGFAVIRVQPYDTVDGASFLAAVQTAQPELVAGLLGEVYVDPRYGTIDPNTGIIPVD